MQYKMIFNKFVDFSFEFASFIFSVLCNKDITLLGTRVAIYSVTHFFVSGFCFFTLRIEELCNFLLQRNQKSGIIYAYVHFMNSYQ